MDFSVLIVSAYETTGVTSICGCSSLPARAAAEIISTEAFNIIWHIFSNSFHCNLTKTLKCFQYWLIDGIYFKELIKSNAKIKKRNASVGFYHDYDNELS